MKPTGVGKGGSRNRTAYALLAAGTVAVGLLVRWPALGLPPLVAKYAGDALYAVLAFWLAGFVLRTRSTAGVALAALAFCCAVESGQLVHTPWLDELRRTLPGRLVLGSWFSWWDLLAYTVGVLAAALAERAVAARGP